MFKKVLVALLIIFCCVTSYLVFFDNKEGKEDTFFIENGVENTNIETLLMTDFEQNADVSVGQLLVFYSRLYGNNIKTYEDAQNYAVLKNIYLPSDLVYDTEEWELLWRNTVLGNTVFEKVNEDTYAIPLIPQYLTIYLNEQGYNLIKQGLIPPQLYFYSPFSGIEDFEEINLNKKVTLGFVLEILMSIECDESIDRRVTLHNIIKDRIEEITKVEEENWTSNGKALYNYYSLSYYGEFRYMKDKGYIDSIEIDDLTKSITVQDFIVLVNKVISE